MEAFALYLFKSVIWLTGFALVYLIFLRNERFFVLKRFYLVMGILISFIFPLISIHYQVNVPAPIILSSDLVQPGSAATPADHQVSIDKPFDFKITLLFFYLAGVLFLAFRMVLHFRTMYKTINMANINNHGPAKLIRASEFPSSFSFFNYVFINPSVSETETEEIMNHELVHVRQKHWLDLLLVEILRLVQWVNPFAWIYTGFIRLNHEYLADEVALQRTADPAIYRAVLLNQMFSSKVISLSNSFNYSLNKKRFDMMKKIITSPYRKMKILFVLPVFAILFYAFATPEYNYKVPSDNTMTISEAPVIIVKDVKGIVLKEDGTPFQGVSILVTGTTISTTTDASGNFTLTDVRDDALIVFSYKGYLTQDLKAKFSKEMSIKLLKDPNYKEVNVIGQVNQQSNSVRIRDSFNSPTNALIVINGVISDKKAMDEINSENIAVVSVLKDESATIKYGEKGKDGVIEITTKKGEPIIVIDDVISTKSFKEVMSEIGDQVATINRIAEKKAVEKYGEQGKYGALEIMTRKRAAELGIKVPFMRRKPEDYPTFRGENYNTFAGWIINQIKYPVEAQTKKIQGWAHVNYTVETDGSLSNIKFTSATHPILGDVIVKAVQISPKWEPAKNPEATEPFTSEIGIKFILPDKVEMAYVVVEEMPMYPGGDAELLKFIAANTQYPDSAKAERIQGRVIIRFILNKDGKAEDITVLKGVHLLLDAEAARVVGLLSGFKPGYHEGRPVNVYYMVPINFTLK